MAVRLRMFLAIVICLALLLGVLRRPLAVRAAVRAYAQAAEDEPALREAVASRGEEVVPTLIQRALSHRCRARARIVSLLRDLEPEGAYHAFAQALEGFREDQRICAVEALGHLGHAEARPLLEWALRSEDSRLEAAARHALRQLAQEAQ